MAPEDLIFFWNLFANLCNKCLHCYTYMYIYLDFVLSLFFLHVYIYMQFRKIKTGTQMDSVHAPCEPLFRGTHFFRILKCMYIYIYYTHVPCELLCHGTLL